jgi:hypothetical protein
VISHGTHAQHQGTLDGAASAITPTPAGPTFQDPTATEAFPGEDSEEIIELPEAVQIFQAPPAVQTAAATTDTFAPATANQQAQLQLPATTLPVVTPAHASEPIDTVPAADTLAPSQLHKNPYRQEMKTWMDSTTGGLPSDSAGANALRPASQQSFTPSWTAENEASAAAQH